MDIDTYQNLAMRTSRPGDSEGMDLAIAGLGLTGEAGEVVELLKKHLGHGHALDVRKLEKELGDVLWYVARIADLQGLLLSDIAAKNLDKLTARYPNGFSHAASQNRGDK